MDDLEESRLITLAQAGLPHDTRCYEQLVRPYVSKIRRYCALILKNQTEAEDAAQEVLIKILLNLTRFRHDKRFSSWLFTIAHNECIDRLRRRREFVDIEHVKDELEMPDNAAEDLNELLQQLMPMLSILDQEILILRTAMGFEFAEIADATGMKLSAVKMRYQRLLTSIQKKLEK